MKKYKVEMTFTISYIMDPKDYPSGASPEICLALDTAEFKAAPEEALEFTDSMKVKGRIIKAIE